MKGKCCPVTWLAGLLLVVGGLNWGLVGVQMLGDTGNLNIVNLIFGGAPVVEGIVYLLVGLSALWMLVKWAMGGCGSCEKK